VRLTVAGSALVAALAVTACSDRHESSYLDVAAAQGDGAFERGWLPPLLPRDAASISEIHDLDTNETWACFAMPSGPDLLRNNLRLAKAERVTGPVGPRPTLFFLSRSWWPESMSEPGNEAYRVSDTNGVIVVGIERGEQQACLYRGIRPYNNALKLTRSARRIRARPLQLSAVFDGPNPSALRYGREADG
jgi:hypothetical protein